MIQRGMRRPRKKFYISKRALRPGNVIFTIVNTLTMRRILFAVELSFSQEFFHFTAIRAYLKIS